MTTQQYITMFFVLCFCVASVFLLLAMNNPSQDSTSPLRFKFWRVNSLKQYLNQRGWRYYKISGAILLVGLIPLVVAAIAQ